MLFYWKKIDDGKEEQEKLEDILYRPEELAKKIIKVLAKITTQTQSVIIATKKGTWQRIAGQKEEKGKDRD